jgi:class 3 adenylate cyclase
VPGVVVKTFVDPKDTAENIVDADAVYGTVPPELLARATKLRWICAAERRRLTVMFCDLVGSTPRRERHEPPENGRSDCR